MSPNRLSSFPFVVVRIACDRCSRAGSYRLARLAERYGADIKLTELLELLSADCKLRGTKGFVGSHLTCGAVFPDLGQGGGPPNMPPGVPNLRIVKRAAE